MQIKVTCNFDDKKLLNTIENMFDEETMKEIHALYAQLIDEYVPYKSGNMADYEVTSEYVRYRGPYALYQYMGEIYGPNLIGREADGSVGWRSPAHKSPTGRELGKERTATLHPVWKRNADGSYTKGDPKDEIEWTFGYTKNAHPLATHHWDKVAMQKKMPIFLAGVRDIIMRRVRELYG